MTFQEYVREVALGNVPADLRLHFYGSAAVKPDSIVALRAAGAAIVARVELEAIRVDAVVVCPTPGDDSCACSPVLASTS